MPIVRALLTLCCLLTGGLASAQGTDQDNIVVTNDVFEITFSVKGGVPTRWTVLDSKAGPGEPGRLDLIDSGYLEVSSFRPLSVVTEPVTARTVASDMRAYEVQQSESGGNNVLVFTSPVDASGLQIVKTYTVSPGYLVTLKVDLKNTGSSPLTLAAPGITVGPGLGYSQGRREFFDEGRDPTVLPFFKTADGVFDAFATPDAEAEEEEAEAEEAAEAPPAMEWGGIASQYFAMAVVPDNDGAGPQAFVDLAVQLESSAAISKLVDEEDREWYPCVTFHHAEQTVAAGQTATRSYFIYAGPKDRALLLDTSLGLEAILFHHLWNWLAGVCLVLQGLLTALEGVLGNWGLAILVFALLFRGVTLPLSLFSAKSALLMQAKMHDLKPLVAEIKVQYKGNSDKLNEAILKLYKEHGINPFSHFKGCLPLMIQLPVLIALFQLLLNSYDLRGASFLWIADLTLTDRLFALPFSIPWLGSYVNLLPLIMFTAMIIVGRQMHVPGREEQAGAGYRYVMPIAMTLLFYPFPAGCMLFWSTGNLLQIAEQRRATAQAAKVLGTA